MIRVWFKNLVCRCCLSYLQPSHQGTAVGLNYPTGEFSHLFLYPCYKIILLLWANHFTDTQLKCQCCKWGILFGLNVPELLLSSRNRQSRRSSVILIHKDPARAGHTFSLVWKGSQMSVWQNTWQSDPFGPICTLGSLPHSICKAVGFLVSSSLRVFSKTQGKWHFPADP